jgi:hypothetical protein
MSVCKCLELADNRSTGGAKLVDSTKSPQTRENTDLERLYPPAVCSVRLGARTRSCPTGREPLNGSGQPRNRPSMPLLYMSKWTCPALHSRYLAVRLAGLGALVTEAVRLKVVGTASLIARRASDVIDVDIDAVDSIQR